MNYGLVPPDFSTVICAVCRRKVKVPIYIDRKWSYASPISITISPDLDKILEKLNLAENFHRSGKSDYEMDGIVRGTMSEYYYFCTLKCFVKFIQWVCDGLTDLKKRKREKK